MRIPLPRALAAGALLLCAAAPAGADEVSSRGLQPTTALNLLRVSDLNVTSPRGPSNNPVGARYAHPGARRVQLDGRLWGECMALVTRAEAPHHALAKSEMSYTAPGERSPLLDYLAATANRTGDYATGKEAALRAWLLAQPDGSVDPLALYRASLLLHGGNIWNAVLAIHQLLRNHARWWATERYRFRSSREEQEALFNKLVDIRGDLSERGEGFHGDHAGSWYRVWGAMLYRLGFVQDATFAARSAGEGLDAWARLVFRLDDLQTATVFIANETAKVAVGVDDDAGKLPVDLAAGEAAAWMMLRLWDAEPGTPGLSAASCLGRRYMKLAPLPEAAQEAPATRRPRWPGYVALADSPL